MRFWRYLSTNGGPRAQVLLAAAFIVMFAALAGGLVPLPERVTSMWQTWIELYPAVATIVIAVFVWHNETRQDWENGLPKRLDVSLCRRSRKERLREGGATTMTAGLRKIPKWLK